MESGEKSIAINVMVSFKAEQMSKETVIEALRYLKRQHGYLRMKIVEKGGDYFFEEQDLGEQENVHCEFYDLDSSNEFENWRLRFNTFGSKNRDSRKSTVFYEFFSHKNNQHQIFMGLNHAGINKH